MNNNTWLRLFVVLIVVFIGKQITQAQCVGPSTEGYLYSEVIRAGGNDLWTYAGSRVVGDYYYNWVGAVTFSMYKEGQGVFNGRDELYGTQGNGGSSMIFSYHDALSTYGTGNYYTATFHEAGCSSGGDIGYLSGYSGDGKNIVKPTINPYGINGVWWLGQQLGEANRWRNFRLPSFY